MAARNHQGGAGAARLPVLQGAGAEFPHRPPGVPPHGRGERRGRVRRGHRGGAGPGGAHLRACPGGQKGGGHRAGPAAVPRAGRDAGGLPQRGAGPGRRAEAGLACPDPGEIRRAGGMRVRQPALLHHLPGDHGGFGGRPAPEKHHRDGAEGGGGAYLRPAGPAGLRWRSTTTASPRCSSG